MSLIETLRFISTSSGVYLMKDKNGKAIYIGKAKSLRSRVRSYFQNGERDQRPQIPYLMQEVSDLDYFVTQSEYEALILENALIKKHKPKYNILLKDDKNYASLRLDPRENFPKLSYTRRISNDGAVYFGPFASGEALRQTKRMIHKIFPLRDCTDEKFKRHSQRPCLNYYMKLCLGPCAGKVNEDKYREVVKQADMFLKGETKKIMKLLSQNMERASEEMRYEDAAHYRDQIRLIEKNLGVKRLIAASLIDKDILGFYREGKNIEFVVLFSRGGAIIDKAEYSFDNAVGENKEVLYEFLQQFYGDRRFIPSEVLIPIRFDGIEVFSIWLSEKAGKRVNIVVPKRGAKSKLIEISMRNAEESFKRKSAEKIKELHTLQRIKDALSLPKIPSSIECFDISNIQGNLAVASMVRFENGRPAKKRYRKFKIKTVFGTNDYGMMYEVLSRRLKRADQDGWELPDMILIDGGKGQLNIAHQVLIELGLLEKVFLASIAKGREEGYSERKLRQTHIRQTHQSLTDSAEETEINTISSTPTKEIEIREDIDRIYIPGRKNPIPLSEISQELLFLMRVRDEAHRFAITYHKKLRGKKSLESELDSIPRIGEKRKAMLLKHFGTVSTIREASVEEISSVPGMDKRAAEEVKRFLT
ncbi:MAG: excinuclease ABC subunit C [Candidatus Dadabacteria bacterium]